MMVTLIAHSVKITGCSDDELTFKAAWLNFLSSMIVRTSPRTTSMATTVFTTDHHESNQLNILSVIHLIEWILIN